MQAASAEGLDEDLREVPAEGAPSRSSFTAAGNLERAPEEKAHIRTALPSSMFGSCQKLLPVFGRFTIKAWRFTIT